MLLCLVASVLCRLLSSGAAQEEDDQLCTAQEELLTPESTSSVSPCGLTAQGLRAGCSQAAVHV